MLFLIRGKLQMEWDLTFNSMYSRVPKVFGSVARKDSVLVKFFTFLTSKDRMIRLS